MNLVDDTLPNGFFIAIHVFYDVTMYKSDNVMLLIAGGKANMQITHVKLSQFVDFSCLNKTKSSNCATEDFRHTILNKIARKMGSRKCLFFFYKREKTENSTDM